MRGVPVDGEKVLRRRKSLGLTQEQLALQANCDVKTVRKAERSFHIDHSVLDRLAVALETAKQDLVDLHTLGVEEANVQRILAWQDAFNDRDVERLLTFYHDEGQVEVVFNTQIPGGGVFSGIAAVQQWLTTILATYRTQFITRDMFQIDSAKDFVFMRSVREAEVEAIATGEKTTAQAAHEFQLQDGKILSHRIFSDTEKLSRIIGQLEPDDVE